MHVINKISHPFPPSNLRFGLPISATKESAPFSQTPRNPPANLQQESSLDANGMREYEATEALGIGKIGAEELEDSQTEEEGRTAWRFGEKESGSELGHGVSMCAGVDDVEISMGRQS